MRKLPVSWATAPAVALLLMLGAVTASAQTTVRVEAESYLAPPASGPNQTGVVLIDTSPVAPLTPFIAFFVCWDYVEWNVNIPEDGTYDVSYRFASDWGYTDGTIPQALTFWTSGQQALVAPTKTAGWSDFQVVPVATGVPLKAGTNRFRIQIRPDNGDANFFGGGMNLDYIEFTKTAAYPNLVAVTGTVTANVGGTPTPLSGAYVSVGADYTAAKYLTRTDDQGKYTLYVPPGAQDITAFYNGFDRATSSVTAPATKDFALTYNGKFEAELFQITNPGYGDADGYQPAYNTKVSNNGWLWAHPDDANSPAKFAEWPNVVVPTAGVYQLSMTYAGVKAATPWSRYSWYANGGPPADTRFVKTFTPPADPVLQTSGKALLQLNAGRNDLRMSNPDPAGLAYVDFFTLTPAAAADYGYLKVVVNNAVTGQPIPNASVDIASTDTSVNGSGFSVATGPDGSVTVLAAPGTFNVTAGMSTAEAPATGSTTVTAGQTQTLTLQLTLNAIAIEAEDFVASGPTGQDATINTSPGTSGGKEVTDFGATDRPEWLEWNVNAPQDGIYEVTVHYKTVVVPTKVVLTDWTTNYQVPLAQLTFGTGYQDWVATSEMPMKAGPNRLRLSAVAGSLNLDYLKFQRKGALPALGTITGKVNATDGTGTAPAGYATVYDGADPNSSTHIALTDAKGNYSIMLPAGSNTLFAVAPGFNASNGDTASTGGTLNMQIATNLPNGEQVEAESAVAMSVGLQAKEDLEDPNRQTVITGGGPGAWFDLLINAPRSGKYQVGFRYASGWNPGDGVPVKSDWIVNGTAFHLSYPTTTAWGDYQVLDNAGTILLNAGLNRVRVTWVDKFNKFDYITLTRIAGLPTLSTDINGDNVTDLRDAVLYLRRLRGLDTGPTPDVDGNGVSDAQDVQRIMNVAGGIM